MKALKRFVTWVPAVVILLAVLFAVPSKAIMKEASVDPSPNYERVMPPELTLPICKEDESTTVASNKSSIFTDIVYGTAPHSNVATVGVDLEKYLYSSFKVDIYSSKYGASSPKSNVIVYGRCNNPLASRLADAVDAIPSGYAWGIAYENGTLALYANSKTALDEPDDLFPDLWSALDHYKVDGALTLPNDLFYVYSVTSEEYAALLEQKAEDDRIKAEEERLEKIEAIKSAIESEFSDSDFDPEGNGITEDMEAASNKSYADPEVYPPAGEHPRVIFTADAIPEILESSSFVIFFSLFICFILSM